MRFDPGLSDLDGARWEEAELLSQQLRNQDNDFGRVRRIDFTDPAGFFPFLFAL